MDGRRLGQLTLRLDAAYCALTGLCLLLFAGPLSEALALRSGVVFAAAVGSGVWALILGVAASRAALRPWLLRVYVTNVLAAGLIAALAVSRPLDAVSVALVAVSIEVAVFAVSQAVALGRPA